MKFLIFPIQFVLAMWAIFFIDLFFINIDFNQFGILPRNIHGLIGILLCPFLHANLFHLISNTVPIFVLLSLVSFFFKKNYFEIVVLISILGGGLLWIFGRTSFHVGASVLIFGLASFIIFFGFFSKKIIPLFISCLIIFVYGTSLLTGLLPIFPGISWEGHLSGAIAGFIIANNLAKN